MFSRPSPLLRFIPRVLNRTTLDRHIATSTVAMKAATAPIQGVYNSEDHLEPMPKGLEKKVIFIKIHGFSQYGLLFLQSCTSISKS